MAIRTIIWDLGGVLMRTVDPVPRERLAARFGKSARELEYIFYSGESGGRCQLGEITFEQHLENVRHILGFAPEETEDFVRQFWGGDIFDEELVSYIRELRGKYKTGLLSNAFPNLREWLEEDAKVDGAFDAMIISAEVNIVKPDPRIYHLALESLGTPPQEAIFIDDMVHNIAGAREVGMHTVHFRDPIQAREELEQTLAM
jgi:epoxide hydrolase-like predicted phosphatase